MKKLNAIALMLLLSVTAGCIQTEEEFNLPPAMDVSISYVNEEGDDLLNANLFDVSYNHYNIYYWIKNEETGEFERVEARNAQYSFPYDPSTAKVVLRLFPNNEFVDGHSITYIESPRDDFDTLRVKGRKEGRGAVAETIWYNGKKVWNTAPNPPRRYFTIIKSQDTW